MMLAVGKSDREDRMRAYLGKVALVAGLIDFVFIIAMGVMLWWFHTYQNPFLEQIANLPAPVEAKSRLTAAEWFVGIGMGILGTSLGAGALASAIILGRVVLHTLTARVAVICAAILLLAEGLALWLPLLRALRSAA